MDMITIGNGLRQVAIGEMLMVALVVAQSGSALAIRHGSVLVLGGVIAYLLQSCAGHPNDMSVLRLPVMLAATGTPLALWLFAHALFERRADLRIAAGAGVVLASGELLPVFGRWCTTLAPWFDRIDHAVMAGLVIHALVLALGSRADDLSEKRRRFSLAFVAIVAVETLIVVVGESWFGTGFEPGWLRLGEAVLIVAAGLVVGGMLLDADLDLIGAPRTAPAQTGPAEDNALSPAERVLHDQLLQIMAEGAWSEAGIAIGNLAERLGVPEHRLRALINRRLGHRNFSAFLNTYRIAAAKARLSDPAHVAIPVLTIAMDLGYGSLAPFNRAFRETTGQTPTDFRRSAFAGTEKT